MSPGQQCVCNSNSFAFFFPFHHYCCYSGGVGIAGFCNGKRPSLPASQICETWPGECAGSTYFKLCQDIPLSRPSRATGTRDPLGSSRLQDRREADVALKSLLLPDHLEQWAVTFRCSSHPLKHRTPNAVKFHDRMITQHLQNIFQHSLYF